VDGAGTEAESDVGAGVETDFTEDAAGDTDSGVEVGDAGGGIAAGVAASVDTPAASGGNVAPGTLAPDCVPGAMLSYTNLTTCCSVGKSRSFRLSWRSMP
jgi:hypothetical protein